MTRDTSTVLAARGDARAQAGTTAEWMPYLPASSSPFAPDDVDAAWDEALAADRPVLIEAVVDPYVPLLPPFPAGEQKLESFRRGLQQEDDAGTHALSLLEKEAEQEGHGDGRS